MAETKAETKVDKTIEVTPYQKFVSDLSGYMESNNVRRRTLLGLEQRPGELTGIEGVRFLAGICQMTDDLLITEYYDKGKRDMPGDDKAFQKAIEELSGKPVDKAVFQGIQESIKPMFEDINNLKPEIKNKIKAGGEPIGDYPVEKITPQKVIFALMLLIQSQGEKVQILPELLKANADTVSKTLKDVVSGHQSSKRWLEMSGKNDMLIAEIRWGVVSVYVGVLLAIGAAIGVGTTLAGLAGIHIEDAEKIVENLTTSEEGRRNQSRQDRYQSYVDFKSSLESGAWDPAIRGADLFDGLNPANGPNRYQALAEFCGEECYLDPSLFPEDGEKAVMELFKIDEDQYQSFQQNPDGLPQWLKEVYPNDLWLAELFEITLTPTNNLEQAGKTEYEQWLENWQAKIEEESNVPTSVSLLGLPMIGGALGRQVRLDRRREDFSQFRGRGRARGRFGSTKGFT